jgi:3-dehydroquinate synthase
VKTPTRRLPRAAQPDRGPPVVDLIAAQQGEHSYPVHVGSGSLRAIGALVEGVDKIALVTCQKVLRTPVGKDLVAGLEGAPVVVTHVLADGERGKTLAELERAAVALLEAGCTRRSLVVALGGGAVTDAAGFLAATFMRGIPWVAVPTTLLSMVDAAIGGKTGANLPVAKNAVGAFHPPRAVLADPAALETLPGRELRSGMGEVLKYGALDHRLLAPFGAACAQEEIDASIIAACARMKVDVVAEDPNEHGPRKLLNLGHTFGHGVEAAGRFSRYTHGEAVAIGLAFAFRLAHRMGRISEGPVQIVEQALVGAGLPVRVSPALAQKAVELMAFDKKRTAGGLRWVLPAGQGVAEAWRVEWDVEAGAQEVQDTVREVSAAPEPKRKPARRSAGKARAIEARRKT